MNEEKLQGMLEAFKHNVINKFTCVLYFDGKKLVHLTAPAKEAKVGSVEVNNE